MVFKFFYEGEEIDLEDELDKVAKLSPPKKAKPKSKNKTNNKDNKRKRTSTVWRIFQMLPTKDEEKPTCKCEKCGKEYIAARAYGIGNLKHHLEVCSRKDTRTVGQLILGQNGMFASSPKIEPTKFRELLCAAITMHELPFQFVQYVGIRAIFYYLCVDVPNISRNTAKNDMVKMCKREKQRMKFVLTFAPGKICLICGLL